MQGKFKFEFLGVDSFNGKKETNKDKTYYSLNLLQGSEVTKVFLSEGQEQIFRNISKMDEIECEIDIKIRGDRTYVSLISAVPYEISKPVVFQGKASA